MEDWKKALEEIPTKVVPRMEEIIKKYGGGTNEKFRESKTRANWIIEVIRLGRSSNALVLEYYEPELYQRMVNNIWAGYGSAFELGDRWIPIIEEKYYKLFIVKRSSPYKEPFRW